MINFSVVHNFLFILLSIIFILSIKAKQSTTSIGATAPHGRG